VQNRLKELCRWLSPIAVRDGKYAVARQLSLGSHP
jgi:hypothetical protein